MSAASVLPQRRCRGAKYTITTVSLTLLLGLPGVCVPASARQSTAAGTTAPVIEETFVLKHIKPSALVTFLAQGEAKTRPAKPGAAPPRSTSVLLTDSIKSVTTDDVFNTVTVQGAPDAITAIRKVAALLDVPPQPVRLTVRIIRYRSAAKAKAASSALPDVEEVASGVVETPGNIPVELSTYGDRHVFRARLIPHINNAGSVSIAADLQMAGPDGTFAPFPASPSGTRMLRMGDRGLITSAGSGIGSSKASSGTGSPPPEASKVPEQPLPETYYLEVTPSLPSPAEAGKTEPPARLQK